MMDLELWTGLPGSGRGEAACGEAGATAAGGGRAWWVVDSLRRAERVEDALLAGRGAFAGIEVLPAGALAGRILASTGLAPSTIPPDLRTLLMRDLLASETPPETGRAVDSPGWAGELSRLRERIAGQPDLAERIGSRHHWMLELLDRYDRLLAEAGRIDEADLPRVALRALETSGFRPPDLLVIDRLGPLRPDLAGLLHRLAARSGRTVVLVDDVENAGPALVLAGLDVERWRGNGAKVRPFDPRGRSAALARRLFTMEPVSPGDSFSVHVAYHRDNSTEVRHLAAELARLVRVEGLAPEQAAVAVTRLEEYAPLIREIFPRYGLRPDLRLGDPLGSTPIARLALNLFELRWNNFPREVVTETLLTPHAAWGRRLASEEGVLEFDSEARAAGIAGGSNEEVETAWLTPLRGRAAWLREEAGRIAAGEDEEGDDEDLIRVKSARFREKADRLEAMLEEFASFTALIHELPDPCGAREAREWLFGTLEKLGVNTHVHAFARGRPGEGLRDLLALGHLRLAFNQVEKALEISGRESQSVEGIARLFRQAVDSVRIRPAQRMRGGVPVFGALDLRGLRTQVLFFAGLSAETWPRTPPTDLLDPFSGRWRDDVDRLAESRALTLEALASAERVYLSAPCPEKGEGREAPSPLLQDLAIAGLRIDPWPGESDPDRNGGRGLFLSPLDLLPAAGADLSASPESEQRGRRRLAAAGEQNSAGEYRNAWPGALRAARIEALRRDPASLTRFEGDLRGEPVAAWIGEKLTGRPLSATRLDTYAQCPLRFFFHYVLRLEELKEVEEEVDAATVGRIVHAILADAARALRGEDGWSIAFAEDRERARRALLEAAQRHLARDPYDNLFWDQRKQDLLHGLAEDEKRHGHLRRVLDYECGELEGERIRHVEAAFGMPAGEEGETLQEEPLVIEGDGRRVELSGRIDRISRHPEEGWRIWDYKTSKNLPARRHFIKGVRFQLPLYLMAFSPHLGPGEEIDLAACYQLKEDKISKAGKWTWEEHKQYEAEIRGRILVIARAMESGRFHHPLSQDGDLCPKGEYNYCPFVEVCRRDHSLFAAREKYLSPEARNGAYILPFQRFPAGGDEG